MTTPPALRPPRPVQLRVNGGQHVLDVSPDAALLTVLRNDLRLNGPKYGCGLGECGACSVLVDGIEARSCVIPVGGVEGREITTLEGLRRGIEKESLRVRPDGKLAAVVTQTQLTLAPRA